MHDVQNGVLALSKQWGAFIISTSAPSSLQTLKISFIRKYVLPFKFGLPLIPKMYNFQTFLSKKLSIYLYTPFTRKVLFLTLNVALCFYGAGRAVLKAFYTGLLQKDGVTCRYIFVLQFLCRQEMELENMLTSNKRKGRFLIWKTSRRLTELSKSNCEVSKKLSEKEEELERYRTVLDEVGQILNEGSESYTESQAKMPSSDEEIIAEAERILSIPENERSEEDIKLLGEISDKYGHALSIRT